MAERLSAADRKAVWALLEDVDGELGPMVAWLPSGPLKDSLEGAVGKIRSAQWRLARELGGTDGDELARTDYDGAYYGPDRHAQGL
jgi:hypothetical protein